MDWKFVGLSAILISFILVIFGFLRMFPLFIATPLLFISIFYTVHRYFHRRSFKGFNSTH
ncbi:hypothetical protein [Alkalihalobacillus sp. AL-G]|uniref:hypothetical protein n=1 Tax=Alkalihalobacillus sp. AL-G TaxID=2926399 RepID=UPI00272BD204|nr:hypothetical protein [Alkalihalobacillus sp. AL-G]WLD94924.1 hypothetical protein MOJ78_08595 [Alkalihalobacillus sp. AL-G]